MISPMATQIGPTLGGTKVSAGDAGTVVVAALAPATGAAVTQRPIVTAAVHNFRIIVIAYSLNVEVNDNSRLRVVTLLQRM
jgi:hypothetical protein